MFQPVNPTINLQPAICNLQSAISDVMTLAYYISGHGFGHASRSIELIAAIHSKRPDVDVVVLTSVAPWFIERIGVVI